MSGLNPTAATHASFFKANGNLNLVASRALIAAREKMPKLPTPI